MVHGAKIVFVIVIITTVTCQWVVDDQGCRTPDGGVGDCISIYDCQVIIDLLTNAPKPLTSNVKETLLMYQCGFSGSNVKVCCPRSTTPILIKDDESTSKPDLVSRNDILKHKNIKLLPQERCGLFQNDDRIINGEKTSLFEFPWMALLSYKIGQTLDFRCGGALINDRYILTAAHCITNLKTSQLVGVRLGEYDIGKKEDCEEHPDGDKVCAPPVQDMAIEEIVPHNEYSPTTYTNDIGLIRLASIANISVDSVQPICLPIHETLRKLDFTEATVTGWGQTESDFKSNVLLKVRLPIFSKDNCKKVYEKAAPISNKQICAGGVSEKDSCSGDSGGPLQVLTNLGTETIYVQYGVVSFGPKPCATKEKPGVYSKVTEYLDWILDNMKP